jgi:hypothetical protein
LPQGCDLGSPSLVRKGEQFWLHTPLEKTFAAPAIVEQQVTSNQETRICAVDLNLDQHLAVCSVQTAEGTRLSTSFIGEGTAIAGTRCEAAWTYCRQPFTNWHHCGKRTGQCRLAARKIRHVDEQIAHPGRAHAWSSSRGSSRSVSSCLSTSRTCDQKRAPIAAEAIRNAHVTDEGPHLQVQQI